MEPEQLSALVQTRWIRQSLEQTFTQERGIGNRRSQCISGYTGLMRDTTPATVLGDCTRILVGTAPSPGHERCTQPHYAPR